MARLTGMRLLPVLLAALALMLPLAGCGGNDDDLGVVPVPAAGENTPGAETPGVPAGASYDVTGAEWQRLEELERFEAAQDYVADHPADCRLAEGSAAADPVRDYADSSLGTDYPLNAPIAELLAEGCAAALQSGESGLAEE